MLPRSVPPPRLSESRNIRTDAVTLGHYLKEEIGLFAAQWQVIANLVNNQQPATADGVMHHFAITPLALRGFEHQH